MRKTYGVLRGGLGNQLFQISAYSALARRTKRRLVLDVNSYFHPSQRSLGRTAEVIEIRAFSGIETIASRFPWQARVVSSLHLATRVFCDRAPWIQSILGIYASENGSRTPRTLRALEEQKEFRYLDAYFGFYPVPDLLESIDKTTEFLLEESRSLDQAWIPTSTYSSIHLRMGDFLEVGPERILDNAAILRAIEAIGLEETGEFMLFSDSIELASELLTRAGINHVRPPTEMSALESLVVMGSSSNLICSRSTFSWWAAKMVSKNGGKVAFPAVPERERFKERRVSGWVYF
jgi:hypothetical protein